MNGRNPLLSALTLSLFGALLIVAGCAKGTSDTPPPGGCGSGLDQCGTACVDLQSTPAHCGSCGKSCGIGQVCNGGQCACVSPQVLCGTACIDVNSDPAHCGGCTRPACSTPFCSNGQCTSTCSAPMLTCGSQCIDPQTNQQNCGSCGHACTGNLPACVAGQCGCPAGQSLCATTNTCTAPSACPTGGGVGGMSGGTGGTNGTAGTNGGVGGTTGGVGGGSGPARACPATTTAPTGLASIDVISDFEEGTPPGAVMVAQGTPKRTGWWYDYGDSATGLTPAPSGSAVASEAIAGSTDMCNKWDFHATATGHPMFAGFGATFSPAAPPSTAKTAYPLTGWDGITFKMKSGGGTNPALFFQVLTKENQPTSAGGNIPPMTTTPMVTYSNAHVGTDLYNARGVLLNSPTSSWQPAIGTNYATYYIPFGMMVPQWVPAPGGAKGGCTVAVTPPPGDPSCQAPAFVPDSSLSFQLSVLSDFAGTAGNYNVIVDDVMLYKRATTGAAVDLPAPPNGGGSHAFPQNGSVGPNCTKPTGPAVDGKFLVSAYNQWKATFVVAGNPGFRVQRPEVGNDTVSEGIAYGMIISVYMNDKALFDGLWQYWKANADSGTPDGPLMKWLASSQGTATDADEDAAFAMLMASRQWTGSPAGDSNTYAANAQNLMHAVLAHDMSTTMPFVLGGSMYKTNASLTGTTNPSYFAPAWYRAFAAADATPANAGANGAWMTLANNAYTMLNAAAGTSSMGLYPAWCGSGCTVAVTNQGSQNSATDVDYQYDAHRIPFRIGLDFCWSGGTSASNFLSKNSAFFRSKAANGIGRVLDIYTPAGNDVTGSAPNSASILGTAAVGAMSSTTNAAFMRDAYQAVFDMVTRASLAPVDTAGKTPYSYYNATVGMLTLLAMTGNLTVF